jgi:methanogenic corrinoid protein MtbC1
LLIVGEMFQRAGWSITTRLEPDPMDLLAVIGQEEFDAVGITVACTSALPRVTQLIDDLRVHSVNPNLMVLAGGALFQGQQHLAAAIGADYVTSDVAQAVDFASRLLEHKRL